MNLIECLDLCKENLNVIEKECEKLSTIEYNNFLSIKLHQIKVKCLHYQQKCDIVFCDSLSDLTFFNFLLASISTDNSIQIPEINFKFSLFIDYRLKSEVQLFELKNDHSNSDAEKRGFSKCQLQTNNDLEQYLNQLSEDNDESTFIIHIGIQDRVFENGLRLVYFTNQQNYELNQFLTDFHPCIVIHNFDEDVTDSDLQRARSMFMIHNNVSDNYLQFINRNEEEEFSETLSKISDKLHCFTKAIINDILKALSEQPQLLTQVMDVWYRLHSLAVEPNLIRCLNENHSKVKMKFCCCLEILEFNYQGEFVFITRIRKCKKIDFYQELSRIILSYSSEEKKVIYYDDNVETIFIVSENISHRRLIDHWEGVYDKNCLFQLFQSVFQNTSKPQTFRPDTVYMDDSGRLMFNDNIPPNPNLPLLLKNNIAVSPFYLHSSVCGTYPKISHEQNLYSFGWLLWILLERSCSVSPKTNNLDNCLEFLTSDEEDEDRNNLVEIAKICSNFEQPFNQRYKTILAKFKVDESNVDDIKMIDIADSSTFNSLIMQSVLTLAKEVKDLKVGKLNVTNQMPSGTAIQSQKSSQTNGKIRMVDRSVGTYDELSFTIPPTERMLLEVGRAADNSFVQMCSPTGDWTWRLEGAQNDKAWSQLIGGGGGIFSPPVLLPAVLEGAKVRFWLRKNICDFATDEMECCCRLDKDTYNQYGTPIPITAICDVDLFHPDTLRSLGRFSKVLPLIELQREVHVFKVSFDQLDPKRPALFHIRFRTLTDWQDSQAFQERYPSAAGKQSTFYGDSLPSFGSVPPPSYGRMPGPRQDHSAIMYPPPYNHQYIGQMSNSYPAQGSYSARPMAMSKSISGNRLASSPDTQADKFQPSKSKGNPSRK